MMPQLRLVEPTVDDRDPLAPLPFVPPSPARHGSDVRSHRVLPHPAELALERAQASLDELTQQVEVLARIGRPAPGRWTNDDGPRAA